MCPFRAVLWGDPEPAKLLGGGVEDLGGGGQTCRWTSASRDQHPPSGSWAAAAVARGMVMSPTGNQAPVAGSKVLGAFQDAGVIPPPATSTRPVRERRGGSGDAGGAHRDGGAERARAGRACGCGASSSSAAAPVARLAADVRPRNHPRMSIPPIAVSSLHLPAFRASSEAQSTLRRSTVSDANKANFADQPTLRAELRSRRPRAAP
jgi:hypothetical protein